MFTRKIVFALVLGMLLCGTQPFAAAQDANTEAKPAAPKPAPPKVTYKLDFSLNELEAGKKINSRHYSMYLTGGGPPKQLNISTRIPIQDEEGKIQHLETGTFIDAHIEDFPPPTNTLDVDLRITSIAADHQGDANKMTPLRDIRIQARTTVISDKPMILGTVDDPDSNREFQLELTATKLN